MGAGAALDAIRPALISQLISGKRQAHSNILIASAIGSGAAFHPLDVRILRCTCIRTAVHQTDAAFGASEYLEISGHRTPSLILSLRLDVR
jgi:hypothetical protein